MEPVLFFTTKIFCWYRHTKFLKLNYLDSFKNSIANSYSNYYFNSGYKFYFENEVYLSPSILTRFVDGAPINTLFALTLNWQENFYFSLNLDLNTSMGGFVGLRFDEKFFLDIHMTVQSITSITAMRGFIVFFKY